MSVRLNSDGYEPEVAAPDFTPEEEHFEYSYQSVLDPDFAPRVRASHQWARFVADAQSVSSDDEPTTFHVVPRATSSTRCDQEIAEHLIFRAVAAVERLCHTPPFLDCAVLFDSIERLEAAIKCAKKRHGATSSTRLHARSTSRAKSKSTAQLTLI